MLDRFRQRSSSKKPSGKEVEATAEPAEDRDGGVAWHLAEEESGDEVLQVRSSNPGIAAVQAAVVGSPRSGTSTVASYSHKELSFCGSDVHIPASASLLDGLRMLLVHHLRSSAGTEHINLTTGQAELLEHHLSRLASYAQKIVHTLAFATRFLSREEQSQGSQGESPSAEADAAPPGGGEESAEPKRSTLKLKDRELLQIYRQAQMEACREADWRGLETPRTTARSESAHSDSSQGSRLFVKQGEDAELLRAISRAMRQPGRTPEALAAEIVDTSSGARCCSSQKAQARRACATSASVRWPKPLPDPGAPDGGLRTGGYGMADG
mmetsp:Transcript_117073/g.278104  ORF Transcript_117073/g.278104 Transcript_117073/m.278104 type:complete len:325 (-) Transcript_117073:93-1067(-)|eukprot:CAMPEP_0181500998 /NCGR_PEP_ID=MMETSP1110-20121109/55543_1 /TAXON_ID=174948 /ORGANISM="Symbiodinium sp., Strain CCMP421" /LENGTH=324 /DNA_ID=CAMNT_0023629393 /DNA_START=44 /DNA_END=1018 /DNA_ORIENTATION=+